MRHNSGMNTRRIYQLLLLCAITASSLTAGAQDATDRDYSAELTRIPPTEPADALKTFDVVPGYKLELVAAEPLVTSPVAASFDEDGRLYVVEMRDYSEQDKEKLGRVRLLTDTDGNGTFDKSIIFAEGLSWPTAIITYDGGVFVGAAPDIFYLKDTNHDGIADERRVVFTGFGRGNVQGLLNSFTWGLDNRIHVAVSSAGAELQCLDEQGRPTAKPLSLRGRDFSFDPRQRKDFIATSGGGQHGMSFDDWGRKFVCSNSDHIQLIMLEDADLARNPYFAAPSPRISIAVDGPQADVFRISPVEPWREVRTRLRVKGLVPGPIEGGGRAAGYFTGATGITIYRGNAWPQEDRGLAIVGDVGGNLVHRKRLEPHGLELRAKRIDEKREFVASRDNWFRPVQFLNAPDGALYVLDMYREVIEHPASLPPAIKKHLDLTSGRDRGRIYRIVPGNFKQPPLPNLSTAKTAELVALLEHENGWHRDMAQRLLYERQDPLVVPALDKLVRESKQPAAKLHALNLLAGMRGLTEKIIIAASEDSHEEVRAAAVRNCLDYLQQPRFQRTTLLPLSRDKSMRVRQQTALVLGGTTGEQRDAMLTQILIDGLDDKWLTLSVQCSLHSNPSEILAAALEQDKFCRHPTAPPVIKQLTAQMARDRRGIGLFEQVVISVGNKNPAALHELFSHADPTAIDRWVDDWGSASRELRAVVKPVRDVAIEAAVSDKLSTEDRVAAVRRLAWFPDKEVIGVFEGLLLPSRPIEIQGAALRGLVASLSADYEERSGAVIVERWSGLSPQVRAEAAHLLSDDRHLKYVLERAIAAKTIALGDVPPELRNDDRRFVRGSKAERIDKDRAKIAESYQPAIKLSADKTHGADLFKKQCSTCHKLGEVGHEIGPNLAAMKARGREAILVNVLDPNREVNPQFVTYAVVTKDGRTLSGMIAAETATSITLKRGENQQDVVLRIDIEELRSTGLSLMPEGLEKQLDQQQLADVIEFIMQSN
jgi:putative membrane-bound dehydrogenase-like protein